MRLRVLALDYDGTIAEAGRLHPEVRGAILEARRRGIVVVLVTGRILADLHRVLDDLRLFDAIVAENGAVTTMPAAGRSTLLAPRCASGLVDELRRRGLDVIAGECVVELDAGGAPLALEVIRELELPLVLHFNRGRLMILPQAVSKGTGLREALRAMRLSVHNAIGIGDAENDHGLLEACEIGVAVSWGSPTLQAAADVVLGGEGPPAVARYLRSVAEKPDLPPAGRARRQLVIGRGGEHEVVSLAVRGRNVLIAGDPRSGKSWAAGLLSEQLVLQGYCVCLIDPEGDYTALEALPGVLLLGGDAPAPTMSELTRTLRHADVSVVLDLARMKSHEKHGYVVRALRALTDLRRETGLPHRIVVDEAHYFVHDPAEASLLDLELAGYTLITYRVSGLADDVLETAECVVITRQTDPDETRLLHERWGGEESLEHWHETLAGLEIDEAVLLPITVEAGGALRRFRLAPRLTPHVRHRRKYADVPVPESAAFHFERLGRPPARSLRDMTDVLASTPLPQIESHVQRGDFSRWIRSTFGDVTLADRTAELEEGHRLGQLPDFNHALVQAIGERYQL